MSSNMARTHSKTEAMQDYEHKIDHRGSNEGYIYQTK